MDGVALGAHAGYGRGAFFLDAQLLGSWLRSDYTDPYFVDLVHHEPNIVSTSFRTLDLRTELGWRLDLGEQLYLEPLAGVSWVRSDSTAATVQSDDSAGGPVASLFGGYSPASLRANLGARVGFEQPMGELHLSLVGTARVWEELRGETKVRIQSVGGNGTAIDTFDGQITEVSLGVNLANASGRISGLIQATGMFGDYESLGLTAGFRYQW